MLYALIPLQTCFRRLLAFSSLLRSILSCKALLFLLGYLFIYLSPSICLSIYLSFYPSTCINLSIISFSPLSLPSFPLTFSFIRPISQNLCINYIYVLYSYPCVFLLLYSYLSILQRSTYHSMG